MKRQSAIFEDGRVILNEATVAELSTLKGVGEKRAQAIVDLREKLGGFKKSSDLLRIRGIGWKSLQKLKAAVVVDRPEAPSPKEPSQEPES